MSNNGQPSNRIISRKFVETTIIILFALTLFVSVGLLCVGIILSVNHEQDAIYLYIASPTILLSFSTFISFLIVHILKVCELEKINSHLENESPKQSTTEQLTYLNDLQKRGVISKEEYEKEKKNILSKM